MQIANTLSYSIMPLMITLILLFGVKERINVYDAFIEGAKTGIQTAMKIMPYMIAIFLVISLFRQSETLGILERLLNPIFDKIGFPKELFSMLLIKPISGSGSLGVVKDIITAYGPDSYIGRTASVMMGSAETIFYTITIYFGVTHVKNIRYTLAGGLVAYAAGVIASIILCRYL